MELLSRFYLYSYMMENHKDIMYDLMAFNSQILEKVEGYFLVDDNNYQLRAQADYDEIVEILKNNIGSARNRFTERTKELLAQLDRILEKYNNKKIRKEIVIKRLFWKIICQLDRHNSTLIPEGRPPRYRVEKKDMPQVFLSHAYDDRLYTLAMFFYFYDRGIYLYIDWMHHKKCLDGYILKKYLNKELAESKQLLFLKSEISEAYTTRGFEIRDWCAWELGNFFSIHPKQIYYTDIYSTNITRPILMLDGIKKIKGVNSNGVF